MTLTKRNGLLLIEVQTEDKIDPQTITGKLKQLSQTGFEPITSAMSLKCSTY